MKTIIIASQKGGSGKTTLAAHLAVEAESRGDAPAWLIDTDPQASLTRWHERRKSETPQRGLISLGKLARGLASLHAGGATWCFIDTPPTISIHTTALLHFADLILIPVRPSPCDLWSVAETVALAKRAKKPFLFVITQAKTQATITAQAIAALSQHGRVAQAFVSDRVAYAAAMTGGDTAPEVSPKGPAAREVSALWLEVKSCFHEKLKTGRKTAHG